MALNEYRLVKRQTKLVKLLKERGVDQFQGWSDIPRNIEKDERLIWRIKIRSVKRIEDIIVPIEHPDSRIWTTTSTKETYSWYGNTTREWLDFT